MVLGCALTSIENPDFEIGYRQIESQQPIQGSRANFMISYSIFVVDDEQTIRDGVSMALENDYRVVAFADAETAINAMKSDPPDLVLLDIGLPGISGIDALHQIRDDHPEVLVVMITAYEDIDTVISSMKAGAHDYVVKPLHMDSLEVTIKNECISDKKTK